MEMLIVDRIEEGIAVCEDVNERCFLLPVDLIPGVHEGDCLSLAKGGRLKVYAVREDTVILRKGLKTFSFPKADSFKAGDNAEIVIDHEETGKRHEHIKEMAEKLFDRQ